MAEVVFSHPKMGQDLHISVRPDEIRWGYGLNVATTPTYGGEVVQILSVYWDDMTVNGTVATSAELEDIYRWFIRYMQVATQGQFGPSFDQQPVTFTYPERGWVFKIWPKAVPGFRYGRDVVAPTWQLTAAVKEPDAGLAGQIKDLAAFNAVHKGQFATFGTATADFGASGDLVNNPWASPDGNPMAKGESLASFLKSQVKSEADSFVQFLGDYNNQQLDSLPGFKNQKVSKPASTATGAAAKNATGKAKKTAKKK